MSWGEHLEHLRLVLMRLREVNLKFNPGKCEFSKCSISFLGHVVIRKGTQPDPKKIKAVTDFWITTPVTNVHGFLGLTGYRRNYVKGYSFPHSCASLWTDKGHMFAWTPDYQNDFDMLKRTLVKTPILIRPDFTLNFFILDVDWPMRDVGAIFSQKEGRNERVIAYASNGLWSVNGSRVLHPYMGY